MHMHQLLNGDVSCTLWLSAAQQAGLCAQAGTTMCVGPDAAIESFTCGQGSDHLPTYLLSNGRITLDT